VEESDVFDQMHGILHYLRKKTDSFFHLNCLEYMNQFMHIHFPPDP